MEQLGAILAAGAGLVACIGAVLIAIRQAKSKGRREAISEADEAEAEVSALRAERVEDKRRLYAMELVLSEHGIEPP